MDEPQAYLNGRFIPASAAALAPTDAGFVLGATVAEQLRTFAGRIFHLDDHLTRLKQSLSTVGVTPHVTPEKLGQVARELVERNHRLLSPGDDLGLAIFVTPGMYRAYAGPAEPSRPTVCMHTYPLPFHLWAGKYAAGQALRTTGVEQVPAAAWPPGLKCRSRMHYYLADRQAAQIEPGARALLLDREGFITEASTANILVFRPGEGLFSPPRAKILPGISLDTVITLAQELGIAAGEHDLRPEDVARADEVLLTSTPLCLVPATRFDGRLIGGGRPGELFDRLLRAWSELVGLDIAAQAVRFAARG